MASFVFPRQLRSCCGVTYGFCPGILRRECRRALTTGLSIVDELRSIFSPEDNVKIVTDEDDLVKFNLDWTGQYPGRSNVVVQPATTSGVSKILTFCNERRIGVVPQGGNTGLVGGGTSKSSNEIVMSMSRMNKIISFDRENGVVLCEAGCVLDNVNAFLEPHGYVFPLDLASSASCEVGGNVATNAGGLRLIRYGSLKGSVLGMEAVLPDGTVLDMMTTLHKDNTGYDLKQLFIGSEGTLGIITKVAVASAVRPVNRNVLLLALPSFDVIPECVRMARRILGETIAAIEFWDHACMNLLVAQDSASFYLLLESAGSNAEHDNEKMNELSECLFDSGLVDSGTLAQNETKSREIFKIRQSITLALRNANCWTFKYDVSLPTIKKINDCTQHIAKSLESRYPQAKVYQFGHIGDRNLHLHVLAPKFDKELQLFIEKHLYEFLQSVGGSVSAEHGLGVQKRDALRYSKKPAVVDQMRRIKHLFDPNGIMNPNKMLPMK